MDQFYKPIPYVQMLKVKGVEPERAVRLYCTSHMTTWALQVRGPTRLHNGEDGKDFIVADASMSREALTELRDAINTFLGEK